MVAGRKAVSARNMVSALARTQLTCLVAARSTPADCCHAGKQVGQGVDPAAGGQLGTEGPTQQVLPDMQAAADGCRDNRPPL
jgi:hypothetical protein